MAWLPFSPHPTTVSLILFVEIVVVNSLIVPTAHSISLRPYERDGHSVEKSLTPLIVQQLEQSSPNTQFPVTNWNNFTPPQRGIPGRREGGGTRGCPVNIALIPEPKSTMARTLSSEPIFFFYIPSPITDETANFLLEDENGNTLYEKTFKLTTKRSGVVGIKLLGEPGTPALEENKKYNWSLVLCQVDRGGWIERVSLSSVQTNQLQQLNDPLQRFNFYARQGLWFEAIGTLAALRSTSPTDTSIQDQWVDLLKSIGFNSQSEIWKAPIIESQLSTETEESGI